jgi:hypothetical protein
LLLTRGARPPHWAWLQPVPRQALEQHRQLHAGQANDTLRRGRPAESPSLKPLAVEDQAGPIEDQDLHPVGTLGPKDEDVASERIGLQRLLHQRGEGIHATPEVDRLGCQ